MAYKNDLQRKFNDHRHTARKRGIEFLLTFEEWMDIWQKSGHLHERGCSKGKYCMSRLGDKGPYAVDNVEIILHSENLRRGHKGKPKPALAGNRHAAGRPYKAPWNKGLRSV